MSKRKIVIMIVVTLAFIVSSRWLVEGAGSPKMALLNEITGLDGRMLAERTSTSESIRRFQDRIKAHPGDAVSYTILGQMYLRQARETGDAASYQRAEAALHAALELLPDYAPAKTTLASAFYAQHNFVEAIELAQQLSQTDPRNASALAVLGDAHLALGHYQAAEAAYQTLLTTQPGPSGLARLAHQAELQGKPEEALQLMERATREALRAGQSGEALAWYLIRLGDLNFNTGQIETAGAYYVAALRVFDGYYLALARIGQVQAAQGQYDQAIVWYERAVAAVPQPEFLAALGDLYAITGKPDQARRQYDTIEVIRRLAAINQYPGGHLRQIYNRQLANFYADHDLHLAEALRLATAELEYRQDIYGFDTAAWAYYKNGQLDEAQTMIDRALQLGTRDAKLYYHAGLIAYARGQATEAKRLLAEALAINTHFDLVQSDIARTTLEQLSQN